MRPIPVTGGGHPSLGTLGGSCATAHMAILGSLGTTMSKISLAVLLAACSITFPACTTASGHEPPPPAAGAGDGNATTSADSQAHFTRRLHI